MQLIKPFHKSQSNNHGPLKAHGRGREAAAASARSGQRTRPTLSPSGYA